MEDYSVVRKRAEHRAIITRNAIAQLECAAKNFYECARGTFDNAAEGHADTEVLIALDMVLAVVQLKPGLLPADWQRDSE